MDAMSSSATFLNTNTSFSAIQGKLLSNEHPSIISFPAFKDVEHNLYISGQISSSFIVGLFAFNQFNNSCGFSNFPFLSFVEKVSSWQSSMSTKLFLTLNNKYLNRHFISNDVLPYVSDLKFI